MVVDDEIGVRNGGVQVSFLSKVVSGRVSRPQKFVIYSPAGLGKSTLASHFPKPLFLDIEGSTSQLDVARIARDSLPNLAAVESAIDEIVAAKPCATLVVDTLDWLEELACAAICAEHKCDSIESNDKGSPVAYGRGVGTFLPNKFAVLLSKFDAAIRAGINVVLLAHAQIKRHEPPDGVAPYDRYELKLKKQVSALITEWCDILCFANYRTQIREKGKGESGEKYKGVGGKERVLYFQRCAAWDAKNRHGLGESEPWGKDASEAFKVLKRALDFSGVSAARDAAEIKPGQMVGEEKLPPLENVKNAGDVAAKIVDELKIEPDEIPMVHDTDKAIVSPEEIEWSRVCLPHEAAINKYLRNHPSESSRIGEKQTFRDVSESYRKRALANPAGFLKVALAGGAK